MNTRPIWVHSATLERHSGMSALGATLDIRLCHSGFQLPALMQHTAVEPPLLAATPQQSTVLRCVGWMGVPWSPAAGPIGAMGETHR